MKDGKTITSVKSIQHEKDSLNKAELSFRVPGTIQELPVKEGDRVEEGQLLAALDPTDFEIAVKDAQASFDRADSDYKRAQELVKKDFISRSDFDAKEAQYKKLNKRSQYFEMGKESTKHQKTNKHNQHTETRKEQSGS